LRLDPDVALHFGVSSRARGFELETIAHNVANGAPDEAGGVPGGAQVIPGGPARRRSTFPAREIMARLHQLRLPCRISRDAGRYLCNATLYRSLHLAAGLGRQRVIGFVHIPTTFLEGASAASSLHGLTFQDAVTGGLAILEACHEHAIAGLTAA
jgi:pyrrolidone-carboxylate peptidase